MQKLQNILKNGTTYICLTLAMLIFDIDTMTPLGIADGLLYIVVILLSVSLKSSEPAITWFAGGISSLFLFAGAFLSPKVGVPVWIWIPNRIIAFFVILVTTILGALLQQAKGRLVEYGAQLKQANEELVHLTQIDHLTGVYNRRYFEEHLFHEYRRVLRVHGYLSVIMLDVDYFKLYNDLYGHQAGDDCLFRIAQLTRTYVRRAGDFTARYGGEEFVVVLPGTNLKGAEERAETIRKGVENLDITHKGSPVEQKVTISAGVAAAKLENNKIDCFSIVKAADNALYRAKEDGRNRVRAEALT